MARRTPKKATKKDPFEQLAEETIVRAEQIKCSFDDFVQGLATLTEALRDRLSSAQDEQGNQK